MRHAEFFEKNCAAVVTGCLLGYNSWDFLVVGLQRASAFSRSLAITEQR
jgi:hypothetical protein